MANRARITCESCGSEFVKSWTSSHRKTHFECQECSSEWFEHEECVGDRLRDQARDDRLTGDAR